MPDTLSIVKTDERTSGMMVGVLSRAPFRHLRHRQPLLLRKAIPTVGVVIGGESFAVVPWAVAHRPGKVAFAGGSGPSFVALTAPPT